MKAIFLAGMLLALPALAEETTTDKVKSATNKGIDKTSDGLQKARVKTQAGAKKALDKTSEALNKLSKK
ncbi:MAG TPA: hypothetical protein VH083_15930, partial [Myxococcales bacterium]|nr:hypothetical protein [Myxococcales bacterium]